MIVCQRIAAGRWFSLVSSNKTPPRYNWNIVESGVNRNNYNPNPKVVFRTLCLNIIFIVCLPHVLCFLTFTSNGSQILTLLSKHWRLNCSTVALQSSSEIWTKVTLFKTLPTSSDDLSCIKTSVVHLNSVEMGHEHVQK